MYQLEVLYSTGNTFGTHDEERVIDDVVFTDIESAKEALQFISQHKKMNDELKYERDDTKRKLMKLDIESKPWAVKSRFSSDYEFALKVRTSKDSTEWTEIYAFWMGYFETLYEVRIIDAGRDELSISFR
ncbi:hypothetical protein SEPL_025 [Salmonella phage SE_PL]|nr:hypothetical protein 7t3_0590 [Salmonella phage 7t3]QIG62638.1 hypothetical protein SEPL_025 [Salmonella phage SE_PL]